MAQSLANINFHLVFSTKHRQPLIDINISKRLYEYIGGTCKEMKCRLIEAGGMPDHIHLLVSWARDLSMSDGLRTIKSSFSRWIHDTFPTMCGFAWQDGYGGFSVSRSQVPNVRRYIQNQEQHHRKLTFQHELRILFDKHEVKYDEKYVWQ